MIIFKKVKYKNFLSTGQQFIEIDLDKLVQLGQMAIMDKMIELQSTGKEPTTELLETDIEQIDMGKKH